MGVVVEIVVVVVVVVVVVEVVVVEIVTVVVLFVVDGLCYLSSFSTVLSTLFVLARWV